MKAINYLPILTAVVIAPMLGGCEIALSHLPGVYSIDIEQGNMVDQGMVDQLRPGMSKRQVLYIMGSPMLADTFHEKRWDYLYAKQPGGEERMQKRIALFFDGDALAGVQGDLHPSALPVVKESNETSVDVPKRQLENTMWEKISGIFESPTSATNPAPINKPATEQTGPVGQ